MDYSKTLNLPQTEFPMRAGLPKMEPEFLKFWYDNDIYWKKQALHEGRPKFVLHDGPPYANGHIHLGHALNKTLKDIIIKYKYSRGYDTPYVPGWDTHGMPIEHACLNASGVDRHKLDALTLRKMCNEYAHKFIDIQREEFKRLGVLGDWDNPYVTLKPAFEAEQIRTFGAMANKGYIYKGKKAVYWCPHCETALAEAEIEYADQKTPTIYVKYEVLDDKGLRPAEAAGKKTFFLIWTTTPWTLPASVAITVSPRFDYSYIEYGADEVLIFATEMIPKVETECSVKFGKILKTVKGSELEFATAHHPMPEFADRKILLCLADYVDLETGTGCVHTAPAHGDVDYLTGVKYKLPTECPVDEKGCFTSAAGKRFEGMFVFDANIPILKYLAELGTLFGKKTIHHQYAHCWRCKNPIIFRATEQWFCSIEGFRENALKEIDKVQWIPGWGQQRIHNMVADRNDWCISRQRVWGVPIPIFYCEKCGEPLINNDTIEAVAKRFETEGSDAWWAHTAEELLPEGTHCPKCGHDHFRKEKDIMDVWFDSGSSHFGVAQVRPELDWPVEMYLEGSDQHRGWFQSSLLTSVAVTGKAPYKAVLTHGYVVDGDGRKMSKSVGNTIAPQDVIKQYGADILRLWCASSDYKADIRISPKILKQLTDVYRKIRNTLRYILGNTSDFDYEKDKVAFADMPELDQWALMRLQKLKQVVTAAYEAYDFHVLYHEIHDFCAVEMSSFYMDVIKDRLYTEKADRPARRSAQTAMYEILLDLIVMLDPVLSFTMEEVYQSLPKREGAPLSVQMLPWPEVRTEYLDAAKEEKWDKFLALRGEVTKLLEVKRRNKEIGNSLDAKLTLYAKGEALEELKAVEKDLADLFIVSQATLVAGEGENAEATGREDLKVIVAHADGEKCERCWKYDETVAHSADHICARCASVLK